MCQQHEAEQSFYYAMRERHGTGVCPQCGEQYVIWDHCVRCQLAGLGRIDLIRWRPGQPWPYKG